MFFISWIKCVYLIWYFLNKSKYLTLLEANRIIIFHDTPNYPIAFTKSNVIVTCTTIINLFVVSFCLFLYVCQTFTKSFRQKSFSIQITAERKQREWPVLFALRCLFTSWAHFEGEIVCRVYWTCAFICVTLFYENQ